MRAIPRLTFAIVAILETAFFVGLVAQTSCASIFGCGIREGTDPLTAHSFTINVDDEPLGSGIIDFLLMRADEFDCNSALANVVLAEYVCQAPNADAIRADEKSTLEVYFSPHIFRSDKLNLLSSANKTIIDCFESIAADRGAPWHLADEDEFWSTSQVEELARLPEATSLTR